MSCDEWIPGLEVCDDLIVVDNALSPLVGLDRQSADGPHVGDVGSLNRWISLGLELG